MTENSKLWDLLGKTDPKHTKPFKRSGGFSGTAIKPMWAYRRMTETFGPVGHGWGPTEPAFQVVTGHNDELLVYCTAGVWYRDGSTNTGTIYGVGGDKITTHIKANEQYKKPERWENDDEAFKKAYTDAITNALKLIGIGADVHMGMFDDSKYVNSVNNEFREEERRGDGADASSAQAEARSPFKNAALRRSFCENVAASFRAAVTLEELLELKGLNAPRFKEMRESGNEHDMFGVEEMVKLYQAAEARLRGIAREDDERRASFGSGFIDTPTGHG